MTTIEFDVSPLTTLGERFSNAKPVMDRELNAAGRAIGFITVDQAVTDAPVDTGNLRGLIGPPRVTLIGNGVEIVVPSHAEYSAAIDQGRRAVVIYPRSAKVLAFNVGGKTVFARRVNQPARAGKPFLSTAPTKAARKIETAILQATERAVRVLVAA